KFTYIESPRGLFPGANPSFTPRPTPSSPIHYFVTSPRLHSTPLSNRPLHQKNTSCLALPKLARVLRTCPFKVSSQSPRVLRQLMGDALSDIAGRPLPVWSWLKASLPSSLGWLNLRQASVHASAAYIGSLHQSRHLVAKILGRTAPQSTFPTPSNPWESIQDIDVPLSQHDQPTVPYEM
ncbi:hypothetical protein GBAR_LOCUS10620, partial [Geodia barretti]